MSPVGEPPIRLDHFDGPDVAGGSIGFPDGPGGLLAVSESSLEIPDPSRVAIDARDDLDVFDAARGAWVRDMAEAKKLGLAVDEEGERSRWRGWMKAHAPPLDDRDLESYDRGGWAVLQQIANARATLQLRIASYYAMRLSE